MKFKKRNNHQIQFLDALNFSYFWANGRGVLSLRHRRGDYRMDFISSLFLKTSFLFQISALVVFLLQFTSHRRFMPDKEYGDALDNFSKGCSDMLLTDSSGRIFVGRRNVHPQPGNFTDDFTGVHRNNFRNIC